MKTRPYDEKDALKLWLTRSEQQRVLDVVADDLRRKIALQLGLHGLRSNEIVAVEPQHVYELDGARVPALLVEDGKTGRREVPISEDLATAIQHMKSGAQLRKDEPVVDVSTRQVRNWIEDVREELDREDDRELARWRELRMHDLRRTWATDAYYSLAVSGVPIAETLTLSFGGWKQSAQGRQTFRAEYLGPVPDHVVAAVVDDLPSP